jgi:hypothetical protein
MEFGLRGVSMRLFEVLLFVPISKSIFSIISLFMLATELCKIDSTVPISREISDVCCRINDVKRHRQYQFGTEGFIEHE